MRPNARRVALFLLAGFLTAFVLPAAARAADVARVEALGVAPLGTAAESRRAPRDRALRDALANAVRQVASDELSGLPGEPPEGALEAALGEDPFEYASRFRVLEDRGERPVRLPRDPDVTSEYVVLAEVHVDAARVRQRLEDSGLLRLPSGDGPGLRTRIALEDVTSWEEIQAVRQLLRDVGAADALPVELERGRAVLEVVSPRSPARLLQELVRRAPATLEIEPRGAGPEGLRLRARVLAPAPAAASDAPAAFDTPGAERY